MILIWVIWGSTTWSQLRVHIPEGFLVFILFGFPGIVVLKPADQCSSGSVAEFHFHQVMIPYPGSSPLLSCFDSYL